MSTRSKRARARSSTSQVAAVTSVRATTCAGAIRRTSRWSTLTAALPLLLSLALLAFFVLGPRGTSPARTTSASMAATGVAALSRVVPAAATSLAAGVDVTKIGDADATYDPAAPRREPEADDVVRVLGEAGLHTRLGSVEPGERVVFQGRVYETRAGPGDELEVRDSGLRVSRVTRTYKRHSRTLVELMVRYGDGREGVLTGTPEHPFYVPARDGYVPMGELSPGVALQTTDGAAATVAARSERHGDFEVYNLEVEHTHNYFVSPPASDGLGVLVHNATYGSGGGPKPNAKPGSAGGPRANKPFTRRGREIVREENRAAHGGKLTCEHCGRNDLVEPGPSRGGQPRLKNEAQVDHIIPEAHGGDGAPSNGQVLCLACNALKRDKL
jgi:pretoxin HINT domain-containing protein/HNH endonuclease